MKHPHAIDAFIADQWASGRFTSPGSETAYRGTLNRHADDCAHRGHRWIRDTDRDDILKTLARWPNQATKRTNRAHLVAYYDWAQRTNRIDQNPARLVQGPKRQPRKPMILATSEITAVLNWARQRGGQDWWALELLAGTGIRNAELRGLQVRDLTRKGWVHIRPENAKGGRERWIPTGDPVMAVRDDITRTRDSPKEYVLASRQVLEVGIPQPAMRENPHQPMSGQALMRIVDKASGNQGADIGIRLTPHMFRHYYGYSVAAKHGIWVAQAVLGHADVGTTVEHYTGIAGEEEIKAVRTGLNASSGWTPPEQNQAAQPKAPTGFEPVFQRDQTRHAR